MKKIYHNFIFVFLNASILFLSSCETDVTDTIDLRSSAPKLVIDGGLERNTTSPLNRQELQLSTTVTFLGEQKPIAIEDATVSVSDGTDNYIFNHNEQGIYINTDIQPEIGKTYTITIIWDGHTYTGKDTLHKAPALDKVYAEYEEKTLFTDAGYFVKFDSKDPEEEENYYYYKIYKNGEFFIVADPGNSLTLVQTDEFFNGKQQTAVVINEELTFAIGDTAKAQQLGISKEYYDFLYALFVQTGIQGGSFIGNPPAAPIKGNLVNNTDKNKKALGFFYAVDVAEKSITITK